jgi:hypothetical protein
MTSEEIDAMAKKLKDLLYPPIVWFVESGERPVAFMLGMPDFNQVLIRMGGRLFPFGWLKFLLGRKKVDRVRLMAFGVLPEYRRKGLDAVCYFEGYKAAMAAGFKDGRVLLDPRGQPRPPEADRGLRGEALPALPARRQDRAVGFLTDPPGDRPGEAADREREDEAREDVDDVVVPAGDRGQDEAGRERKEGEERLPRPPGRLDEDRDRHHRVPRREAVPPARLETIEGVVDRLRDRPAGKGTVVRHREAGSDRRHDEVAGVADVEDEEHPEDVGGEARAGALLPEVVFPEKRSEDDGVEVVEGVADGEDLEGRRPQERLEEPRRVVAAEEEPVRRDEEGVQVDRADGEDERAEVVEDEEEREDRPEVGDARQEGPRGGAPAPDRGEDEREDERRRDLRERGGRRGRDAPGQARDEEEGRGPARQEVGECEAHAAL